MKLETYLENGIRDVQHGNVSVYDGRFAVYGLCGLIGFGILLYLFGGPLVMITNFFLSFFKIKELSVNFFPTEISDEAMKLYLMVMMVTFLIFFFLHGVLRDQKKFRALMREYKKKLYGGFSFSQEDYQQAAEALRKFRVSLYDDAVQKYGKNVVDILLLTKCVAVVNKYPQIQRIVSIKSIEEDREAGWEDDEEAES